MVVDHRGTVLYANRVAKRRYGLKKADMGCKSIISLVVKRELPRARAKLAKAFGGKLVECERFTLSVGGKERMVYVSASPITKKGRVEHVVLTARETARICSVENELRREKEFSERIIRTVNAIIVGLDSRHRIRMFNNAAERITGYSRGEVMGKDWFRIFFKKKMLREMGKVWKAAWGKDIYNYVNPIYAKGGEEKIIMWSNTSLKDERGGTVMVVAIGQDITARRRAEEKLERHVRELEKFQKFAVGREMKMVELKKRLRRAK